MVRAEARGRILASARCLWHHEPMPSSRGATNLGGRPATGKGTSLNVRLQPGPLSMLDDWISTLPDPKPSRPEAIRRIVDGWFVSRVHEAMARDGR